MSSLEAYIVVFKKSQPVEALEATIDSCIAQVEQAGGRVTQRYDSNVIHGFAATMTPQLKTEFEVRIPTRARMVGPFRRSD
ncbi:hypothetical protein JCM11491_006777 [Sporobolomyces phaffii]